MGVYGCMLIGVYGVICLCVYLVQIGWITTYVEEGVRHEFNEGCIGGVGI